MWSKRNLLWLAVIMIGGLLIGVSPLGRAAYMNIRADDDIISGWQDYRAMTFEAALRTGEPLLVEVYASWCPSCMAQHKAFEQLQAERRIPPISVFRGDFDRDRDFLHRFGVRYTSTLILFDDGEELARTTGLIEPDAIEAFLTRHLSAGATAQSGARPAP